MKFMMILNDPQIARFVCSVETVEPFVDLETLGKAERQGHLSTWKSKQTAADVTRIREAVPDAHLIVRINPLNDNTRAEIDDVIARGADSIMLPMFHDRETLERFLDILNDRAAPLPLFETAASVAILPSLLKPLGLQRLHIGLNDLHLDLGRDFLFQPLAEGLLEEPAAAMREAGTFFGIGGVARAREGIVSPEFLLGEHVRLGSQAAILSQTFHRNAGSLQELSETMNFKEEVQRLSDIYDEFSATDAQSLEANRIETRDRVNDVASQIRAARSRA
ncbi:MAG: hypothetical protein ACPGVK_06435 [Halocynthiibacter sp.]